MDADFVEQVEKEMGLYLHDGIFLRTTITPAALDAVKETKFFPDDVLVISYPKSGTTWLQEMTWLATHDANVDEAQKTHLTDRMPFMEQYSSKYDMAEVFHMSKTPPRFIKTHLPSQFLETQLVDGGSKAIIIRRDLKDTLVSYFNHNKNSPRVPYKGSWDAFFERFQQQALGYGDWGVFYKGWQKYKDNPNFLFLQYERLKLDRHQAVRMVAKHCGKVLTEEQVNTIVHHTGFEQMKANPMVQMQSINRFFRKGVVGDWANYFSEDQVEYVTEYEKQLGLQEGKFS